MTGSWSKEMSKSKQKKISAKPDYEVGRGKETSLSHDVRGRVKELGGSPLGPALGYHDIKPVKQIRCISAFARLILHSFRWTRYWWLGVVSKSWESRRMLNDRLTFKACGSGQAGAFGG